MCNISTPFQGQRLIRQTTVELGEGVRKCGNKLFSSLSLTLLFWPRSTFPCMPRSPWNAFPLTRMQSGRLCEPSCEVQFSYQLFARHLGNLIHVIRRVIVVYTDVHITIKIHCEAKKLHPYYFCNNFVKPHNIFIIFVTQILQWICNITATKLTISPGGCFHPTLWNKTYVTLFIPTVV